MSMRIRAAGIIERTTPQINLELNTNDGNRKIVHVQPLKMVYRGVPSKACHECRVRRTRCNEARPTCGQCKRTGRLCGYRDPVSILFRNENEKLCRKSTISLINANESPSFPTYLSTATIINTISEENWQLPLQLICPGMPEEEQAVCHVFHHYVFTNNPQVASKGYLDFLPDLMCTPSPARHSYLSDAVIALGLAGIAKLDRSGCTTRRAKLRYNKAVSQIGQLLGDTKEATKDELLVAVMILGLFESNAPSLQNSIESWMQHVKGSFELLRLRGTAQLQTNTGHRLFLQIRTQFIRSCIQRRIPIPPELDHLSQAAERDLDTSPCDAAISRLFLALRGFCALRASLTHSTDFSDPVRVIDEGLAVDIMLAEWAATTPPEYSYISVAHPAAPNEDVFGQSYDVYTDIFVASTWNNYRSVRIILHELLVEQLQHLCSLNPANHTLYSSQISLSRSIMTKLTLEICASVPFYFDLHLPAGERYPKAIGGNLLMWALYGAAVAAKIDWDLLVWMVGSLTKIAKEMGVGHAAVLAEVCARRCEVVWDEREKAGERLWSVYSTGGGDEVCIKQNQEISGHGKVSLASSDWGIGSQQEKR